MIVGGRRKEQVWSVLRPILEFLNVTHVTAYVTAYVTANFENGSSLVSAESASGLGTVELSGPNRVKPIRPGELEAT